MTDERCVIVLEIIRILHSQHLKNVYPQLHYYYEYLLTFNLNQLNIIQTIIVMKHRKIMTHTTPIGNRKMFI